MSAKKRIQARADLDFKQPDVTLAWARALLIYREIQAGRIPACAEQKASEAAETGRGRPATMDTSASDYEFDVRHNEALRELGYSNVPPDKHVLDKTIERYFPDRAAGSAQLQRARQSIKNAVKYRRAKPRASLIFHPIPIRA